MKPIGLLSSLFTLLLLLGCKKDSADSLNNSSTGIGGSLARFAIAGSTLYTVNKNDLQVFNINDPSQPIYVKKIVNMANAETIFVRDNSTLFIGAQEGMYSYDISDPNSPALYSLYSHIQSCDPVVADNNYAYVTLRVENNCNSGVNRLEIVDISNLYNPYLLSFKNLVNPKGLAIDGNKLYICDEGMKLFDKSDINNVQLIKQFDIPAIDVIAYNDTLMAIAKDGFYQYAYAAGNLTLLSRIPVKE